MIKTSLENVISAVLGVKNCEITYEKRWNKELLGGRDSNPDTVVQRSSEGQHTCDPDVDLRPTSVAN